MYERIMVPLDGSSFAECALPLGVRLARRARAELRLVMVAEPDGLPAARCEEYLERVAERIREDASLRVTTVVGLGAVVPALLKESAEAEGDLTVMATHGRGGVSRMWLGSVASGYLHETREPLVLVRPDRGEKSEPVVHWGFARILVPLDGTPLSERVLNHATDFGRMFDASYHLTRVVSPPVDVGAPYAPAAVTVSPELLEAAVQAAEKYLDERAAELRSQGLEVTTAVRVGGQPGPGILEEADASGCDSIAMATHGRAGISRVVLGSTTDKVVRAAAVPVLVYRPENVDG